MWGCLLPLWALHHSPFEFPGVVSLPGYWPWSPFVLTGHSPFVLAQVVVHPLSTLLGVVEQFEDIDCAQFPSDRGHVLLELG